MKVTPIASCLHRKVEGDFCPDKTRAAGYPWWLYFNLLSLDAPLVAILWLATFSHSFESPVTVPVTTLLFLSVWSIYIADRLVDGFRQKNWELSTERHVFVRRHCRSFFVLLAINLSLAAGIAITSLPLDLFLAGLALCLVVAVYFGVFVRLLPHWRPLRAKEFACGIVFAFGTVMGVDEVRWGIMEKSSQVIPAVFLFAGLCTYNCLVIAARESSRDQVNDRSAASTWWAHLDRDLVIIGSALVAAGGAGGLLGEVPIVFTACFISALLLVLIHIFRKRLSVSLTRVLVDAALLSPVLLLI